MMFCSAPSQPGSAITGFPHLSPAGVPVKLAVCCNSVYAHFFEEEGECYELLQFCVAGTAASDCFEFHFGCASPVRRVLRSC
jgi:hypothetical protein